MKEKALKYLLVLAGFAAMTASGFADVVYPGCPVVQECCVCDVLPDTYNYGVMFGTVGCETKKLIFSGLIQTDYQFIHVDDRKSGQPDPSDVNNFFMRRVRLGFEADLGENWRGVIVLDFAGKETKDLYINNGLSGMSLGDVGVFAPDQTMTTDNKHGIFGLYKAYIEKYCAGNFFRAGYKKVNFVREENIEDYDLKTIERSIATFFFNGTELEHVASGSPLGFGERHVGLYLDGMYDHFGYGAALVNGYQGTKTCSEQFDNELGVFANIYYQSDFNCMDIELGVNVGYKPKGNNRTLRYNTFGITETPPGWQPVRGEIWAVNPYVTINWQGWSLLAEVMGAKVEHGAVDGMTDASPIGVNGVLSYMWNDCWEFVFRGSYLDTDHRGVRISNVIPCAPDTKSLTNLSNPTFFLLPAGDLYDTANAWYFGFNYYMSNRAIKFSAGYEFTRFKNRHSGLAKSVLYQGSNRNVMDPKGFETPTSDPQNNAFNNNEKAYVHVFRAQLQLVF